VDFNKAYIRASLRLSPKHAVLIVHATTVVVVEKSLCGRTSKSGHFVLPSTPNADGRALKAPDGPSIPYKLCVLC
jgi:hypothetical protein